MGSGQVQDPSGNALVPLASNQVVGNMVVDTTPPVVTGISDVAEIQSASYTWNWGCSESPCYYRLALVSLDNYEHDFLQSNLYFGYQQTEWTAERGRDGVFYFYIQAKDEAGNASAVVKSRIEFGDSDDDDPDELRVASLGQRECSTAPFCVPGSAMAQPVLWQARPPLFPLVDGCGPTPLKGEQKIPAESFALMASTTNERGRESVVQELLIYPHALPQWEREQVESYLGCRWGERASLRAFNTMDQFRFLP